MPNADRATVEAELTVVAEAIDRYRDRIAALASSTAGAAAAGRGEGASAGSEDMVAAMHEAERALRSAHRHLVRASKLAR